MSYKFADHLLLRMPVKSWNKYTFVNLHTALNDPFFLAAVYIASPGFYGRLQRSGFSYLQLSTRERNTLKKYYNRICFRPTPFGLFSAVSLVTWGDRTDISVSGDDTAYVPCIKPDQACVMAISRQLLDNELKDEGLFLPNPTLYRAGKEYRFVYTTLDAGLKTRDYDLRSAEYAALLKMLLKFCREGKTKPEMVRYIIEQAGCPAADAEAYFQFMADSQLLVNDLQPNITGKEYLQRLAETLGITDPGSPRLPALTNILALLNTTGPISPEAFIALDKKIRTYISPDPEAEQGDQLSLILEVVTITHELDAKCKTMLADALFALDKLVPQETSGAMDSFIKVFKKQFDQQSIPLLKALDPEIGIGYQARDTGDKSPLLETLNIQSRPVQNTMKWTPAHRYLLNCWHSAPAGTLPVIRLKHDELLKLGEGEADMHIQGISVLFRLLKDGVFVETAGGINAPALLGRFTVASKTMASAARQIAQAQEAAYPNILFAELTHLSDPHTDNINRRERVWTKELPITAISLAHHNDQLQLADIYVSVENDKVVLRSLQHNKIVMPRLTSAYNHTLNKLPLFCFLADVPYQFGRSNYTLDMAKFFPGLSFYPRVEYRAAILYPATWVLKKEELTALEQDDDAQTIAAFDKLAMDIKLPPMFSLVQGDQQLVFYRDREEDALLFADSVKNKNEVIIKEYFHDEEGYSAVNDIKGNAYVSQFNAFVYPDKTTPLARSAPQKISLPTTRRHFVLGSEWLYLKIYVPKVAISGLLLKIAPLLSQTYSHGPIGKWFFIRYEDHAPHIRLRMKMPAANLGEVLAAFRQKLEKSIYQHVVREYHADTYTREVERYQAGNYELTEDLFWRSSQLVLQMLRAEKRQPDQVPGYIFALYTTRDLLDVFLPDKAAQINFVQVSYQQFMLEFDDKKITFELDKKYRELSKIINTGLRDADLYLKLNLRTTAARFLKTAGALAASVQHERYKSFLSAIIHMHLNRVFTDDPRKQEMITFYFLYKYLVSDMARKK